MFCGWKSGLKLWKWILTSHMLLSNWNFPSHKDHYHFSAYCHNKQCKTLSKTAGKSVSLNWFYILIWQQTHSGCAKKKTRANWDGEDETDGQGRMANTDWFWTEEVSNWILHFKFQCKETFESFKHWRMFYTFIQHFGEHSGCVDTQLFEINSFKSAQFEIWLMRALPDKT